MKSAATETSAEIKNSAEWTALRAMIVSRPATSAASPKTQKKTLSQPDKVILMSNERRVMKKLSAVSYQFFCLY
jgi:hypothetical protein